MAVRRPLYWDGSALKEMSDAQITEIKNQAIYLYGLNPNINLSIVTSGGNLGTISDTRLQAGAFRTFTTRFPTELETAEPSTVTVNYSRLQSTTTAVAAPTDTNNKAFATYYSSGSISAMTLTDIYDTFIYDAIDTITNGTDQPGTYRIHTSTTLAGHTLVSATPVFSDTRANTGLYTSGGIPEQLDQPFTVTNYYLFKVNAGSTITYQQPLYINADNDLQIYTTTNFNNILSNAIRSAASSLIGSKISYNINGSGNNRGTGISNTKLNGSGLYTTRYVNANDYRAQEFPNGSVVSDTTYFLRITQV